jgi:hypothetical protein
MSVTSVQQVSDRKKINFRVKLLMGTAFLAEKRDYFLIKSFHLVCEAIS